MQNYLPVFIAMQFNVQNRQKNDDDTWTHTDTDVSGESAEVQAIATAVWTDAVKAAARTANEAAAGIQEI